MDQIEVGGSWLAVEHRPGPGPLVVFLHAGVCDQRSWRDALPAGVATLTYDRRGFGRSPLTPTGFSHLEDLRAVLEAVTDEPVVLVGSSMGGGLALDAALELPGRVSGLLLLAPAVSGAPSPEADDLEPRTVELDEAIDAAVEAGDVERAVRLDAELWLDGPLAEPGRVAGAPRDLFLEMDRIVLRTGAAEHGGSDVDAWSRLGELDLPVTLATGDLDAGYLQARTTELQQRVRGSVRAELPGTAHLPYLDRPDLVRELVAAAAGQANASARRSPATNSAGRSHAPK